jgi:hypothetical protein
LFLKNGRQETIFESTFSKWIGKDKISMYNLSKSAAPLTIQGSGEILVDLHSGIRHTRHAIGNSSNGFDKAFPSALSRSWLKI